MARSPILPRQITGLTEINGDLTVASTDGLYRMDMGSNATRILSGFSGFGLSDMLTELMGYSAQKRILHPRCPMALARHLKLKMSKIKQSD